jgi:hypothetical protein
MGRLEDGLQDLRSRLCNRNIRCIKVLVKYNKRYSTRHVP